MKLIRAAITFTSRAVIPLNTGNVCGGMCSMPSAESWGGRIKKLSVPVFLLNRKLVVLFMLFPAEGMSVFVNRLP